MLDPKLVEDLACRLGERSSIVFGQW